METAARARYSACHIGIFLKGVANIERKITEAVKTVTTPKSVSVWKRRIAETTREKTENIKPLPIKNMCFKLEERKTNDIELKIKLMPLKT